MTRKKLATELMAMVRKGPYWCTIGPKPGRLDEADAHEATQQYSLWAESWIIPALTTLIPELKESSKT